MQAVLPQAPKSEMEPFMSTQGAAGMDGAVKYP